LKTSVTVPPGVFDDVTFAVKFTLPPEIGLQGTFTLDAVRVIDEGTGPPPPPPPDELPPPHPKQHRSRHDPNTPTVGGVNALRPGREYRVSASKRANTANATIRIGQEMRGHSTFGGRTGNELTVFEDDGANVVIVNVEEPETPLARFTVAGEKLQAIPKIG